MRQVFTVDNGRSCRVECRSPSSSSRRKRGRSSRDAPRTRKWQEDLWAEEEDDDEEADFMPDSARSVTWGANGLTIRARNSFSDSRSSSRDSDSLGVRTMRGRRQDPYDLWGFDDDFEDEYRARDGFLPRQEEFQYSPRSHGPNSLSYRRNFADDDRRHEPRGYTLDHQRGDSHARERETFRCRSEREHSWERSYARRFSPPPRPRERDRFDYVENSGRRLSPPRLQFRDRYDDIDHHSWEDGNRRREEYSRAPETKPPPCEDDDLPPGFGSQKTERDSRTCYRCDKVGHLSVDCPSRGDRFERSPKRSKVLEESKGKTCFTCGLIGHFSFQCPTRDSKPAEAGRGKQCYSCGEHGHMSYECPSKSASGEKDVMRSARRCYNCYETGHLVHECPMFQDAEPRNGTTHVDSANVLYKTKLTDSEKNQYLRENRCFTCGKSGHPYYSCPQSEKRLEYVFFDREQKSTGKLLKNPCWKYVDNHGEVHGPVSLSALATRLDEGVVQGDYQAHHMYNGNLQPISVKKLVRISKSESLIAILSCMPEATAFLGEEMDAESCKDNAVSALQTKLHYDIFETTVRWIVISSMNEALQVYKTARKHWGRNRPPTAEDYLEPDKSRPPHSSDCESPPDGTRASHFTNTMMLVECEAFASDSSLEEPKSIALEAIQKSIHARVLGAVRTGILDATTAKYLDRWIQPRKMEVTLMPEAISEENSGDSNSKGTKESSPSPMKTSEILDFNHTNKEPEKQEQQKRELKSFQRQHKELKSKDPILSDQQERKTREQKQQEVNSSELRKPSEQRCFLKSFEKKQQKQQDLLSLEQQRKPSEQQLKHLKEQKQQKQQQKQEQSFLKQDKEQQPAVAVPKLVEGAVDLDSFMRYSSKQQKQEKAPELVLHIFRKKKSSVTDQPDDSSQPAKKRVLKLCELLNPRAPNVEEQSAHNPELSSPCVKVPKEPHVSATEKVEGIPDELTEPSVTEKVVEEIPDELTEPRASATEKVEEIPDEVTEPHASATEEVEEVPDETTEPHASAAEKEVVEIPDEATEPHAEKEVEEIPDEAAEPHASVEEATEEIQDEATECLGQVKMEVEVPYDNQEGLELVAVTKDEEEQEMPNSSCPQSSGCARSSISGWEWRNWSRTVKYLDKPETENIETENNSRPTFKAVRPTMAPRLTRAQARKQSAVSDGQSQLKARKKRLKFQRSNIHSWGVATMEPIEAEDFVAEYVGELVRPTVADLRESRYRKQAVGSSYLLRTEDDYVIDATVRGGLARFINHSCEPNCYTKITTVEGQKRVFIYARNFISAGTELTYDYKYQRENEKLPCFCGTSKCRGFLNV